MDRRWLVLCGFAVLLAAPKGDVAPDSVIDVRDVHVLQRALRGFTTLDSQQQNDADVAPTVGSGSPGNGQVDTGDLAVLRQAVGFGDPDGDDLGQAYEELLGFSLFVRDSNGNGVPDGQEDPDQDGLSNRNEEDYKTNPLVSDTDGDGVLDGRDAPVPVLAKTAVTDIREATKYLYTGLDPIQSGLNPSIIDGTRVAVIRGKVTDENGAALPGVAVSVLGRPEYGSTRTLSDGGFDLVVNGGDRLTLALQATGRLAMWRRVDAPVLDYKTLPDASLQVVDSAGTGTIALSTNGPITHWRGSTITDARGSRRPTVIFQPGTTAQIHGTSTQLANLTIHATESTKGGDVLGVPSVPLDVGAGHDPAWIADFTVDEAPNAEQIDFLNADGNFATKPAVLYFEDFLGYDVGESVGNGTLDLQRVAWTETGNPIGGVVKITAITTDGTGPIAQVDTDSTAGADNIGLGDDERRVLAQLYPVNQKLFRVPMKHFSRICTHKGVIWPLDAKNPDVPVPASQTPDQCNAECGSIIAAEGQILKERIGIAGTPWSLHYTSERTPGYRAAYRVRIPLTGPTIPNSLAKVRLLVEIAGQKLVFPAFDRELPANDPQHLAPNLSQLVTWTGEDAYERRPQGRQPVRARIEWAYPFRQTLLPDGTPAPGALLRGGGIRAREWQGYLGPWDNRAQGLGGWTLTPVHAYDARTRILYRGDGERVSVENLPAVISTVNKSTLPNRPESVVESPAGTVYVGLPYGPPLSTEVSQVGRINLDGTYTRIAGTGCTNCQPGDGGAAKNAWLRNPTSVAFGPDGSLFISDSDADRVRKVAAPATPDSIITTVAGTGTGGFSGDGGLATSAQLNAPQGIVVAKDGSLYISDGSNGRVRVVSPDGFIRTVAGSGSLACQTSFTNAMATTTNIGVVADIALGSDGSLYIASNCDHVYRVTSEGALTRIAGRTASDPAEGPDAGNGGPATQARLYDPRGLEIAADGSLYIAMGTTTSGSHRVRLVTPDGLISTVAGDGTAANTPDGGPAARAQLNYPVDVALDATGRLLIAELNNASESKRHVRRIEPPLPGMKAGDVSVASSDGRELYTFDAKGRHLATRDAVRNAVTLAVTYDDAFGLTSIDDQQGNVTTIERNAQGIATALVGPFGDRTTLDVNPSGWLTRVVDPAGGDHDLAYDPGTTSDGTGLLTSYTTPEEHTSIYTYDDEGLLTRDDDAAGGFKTLDRTDALPQDPPGWEVAVSTRLARTNIYTLERAANGTETRSATDAAGLTTTRTRPLGFTETTTEPAGLVTVSESNADPRLGYAAAYPSRLGIDTPAASPTPFLRTVSRTSTTQAGTGLLTDETDTIVQNGRTSTVVWDHDQTVSWLPSSVKGLRRTTLFVPSRILDEMLDARGRLVGSKLGDLHPLKVTYDARGRLASLAQGPGSGDRMTSLAYDASSGRLASVTDAASRITTFDLYDAAGRVREMTLPGNRVVAFTYDSNGNLTSLTPPGQPAHVFRYTALDQEDEYEPPALAGIPDPRTIYDYNFDRQLELVTRPDGKTVDLAYESTSGRLDTVTIAEGVYDLSYFPLTATPTTDPDGQLQSIAAPGGEGLAFAWDGRLPLSTTWTGPVSGSLSQTFDPDFRVATETVAGTPAVSYAYDGDSLHTSAGPLTITRNGQSAGLVTGTTLGTVTTSETPNAFAELDADGASVGGSPIYANTYTTRDALGRITAKTETIQGVTTTYAYSYTAAGQLDVVTVNGTPARDYDYDANGNRTHVNGVLVGAYDAQDRLTSYQGTTYTYTAAGDLASQSDVGGTTTYAYDALGNLRTVVFPSGMRIEYVIDGRNRRVGKKVCAAPCTGGAQAQLQQGFLFADQLRVVAELDGSNNVVSRFVYGTKANVPDYMVKGGVTYRVLSDHLGSVRLVVNSSTGALAQRIDYDEWGNATADSNPGFQPFGFAGGLSDRDTGLVRFGARDYDPRVGRWTSKDPIRFRAGDSNLLAYAMGDPINKVDADGRRVYNNSPYPVVFKPEEDVPGGPFEVPPFSCYPGPIDGAKPPAWGGDWYKVPTGDHLLINRDGTAERLPGDGLGAGVPDAPDLGSLTDRLPGRKQEPGFSDRNQNFR